MDIESDSLVYVDTRPEGYREEQGYVDEISIDPDGQLTEIQREEFRKVCEEFSSIITPAPGKYNGFYGSSDSTINFTSLPPPT